MSADVTLVPVDPIKVDHAVLRETGKLDTLYDHFREHGYLAPHPFAVLFPRMTDSEQAAMTASIRDNGIREPVAIFRGYMADGRGRCISAIQLGFPWEDVPKFEFEGDETSLLRYLFDQNVVRRHLNESQRAMIAAGLANMPQGARVDLAQICAMSQQQAADQLNVSRRLVQDAVKVLRDGVPELVNAVRSGILPVSEAVKVIDFTDPKQKEMVNASLQNNNPSKMFRMAIRNANIDAQHQNIIMNARRHALQRRVYHILVVDPPWVSDVSRAGSPFPRLTVEQLCEFRVDDGRLIRDVLAKDAIILIWVLDHYVDDLPTIREAWGGLTPRGFWVWPKPQFGVGHFDRPEHELVAVCTRGDFAPPQEHLRPSSLIRGPRHADRNGFDFASPHDSRHSSKPDRLQEKIERSYPQYFGPETIASPLALELFARNYRPRWAGQGFEYPGRPGVDSVDRADLEEIGKRPPSDLAVRSRQENEGANEQ